jgi:hypothetical protein
MVYLYLILGVGCMLLSGVWLGSIFTDNVFGYTVSFTQYFMTVAMFITGLCQFLMLYRYLVLE